MAAKCAEQLARDVEKQLKIRTDPDPSPDLGNSSGNSSVSQGIYYTTSCIEYFKLRLTFNFTVAGLNIDSSRVSKHNEGLERPRGMKVKEKTVRGSARPVGGLEKAKTKKKKKIDDSLQLQPEMPFTNEMSAYNPILMV